MYEEENSTSMEYNSDETWDNSDDPEAETQSVSGDPTIDLDAEDFVSSGEDVVSVLDVFNKEDDTSKIKVLKDIFNKEEVDDFINTYKEEEAKQAELMNEENGDDYFLLKYIDNHQEILEEKEEEIAEALNLN